MAFQAAANWNNLPRGNFVAEIFSAKAQLAFRKKNVVSSITNSDYFGEIADKGDTVRIIKEPEITVREYARGTQIQPQDLDDEEFTLTVDQANYYAFKVDDIEAKQAHHNWESLASNRAGYRLSDNMDQNVLAYMCGYKQSDKHVNGDTAMTTADLSGTNPISTVDANGLLAAHQLDGTDFHTQFSTASFGSGSSIPIGAAPTINTSDFTTALRVINRMKRILDQQYVPEEDRWIVLDPVFLEILRDEESKFINSDQIDGQGDVLRNGRVGTGKIQGFYVHLSNNLPVIGTGPATSGTTSQLSNFGVIVAGHKSAVATAEQINKTEDYRDPDSFADVVRGMHLFGRKLLRPESIVTARYNLA